MKNIKLLSGLVLLTSMLMSGAAWADHGHVGVGFYFGAPYPYPYYSPYPYPYYPPAVVMPVQPQVYIEQASPQISPLQAPIPQSSSSWYHCDNPEGYYPYIKECPGGWKAVAPTPPPQH